MYKYVYFTYIFLKTHIHTYTEGERIPSPPTFVTRAGNGPQRPSSMTIRVELYWFGAFLSAL